LWATAERFDEAIRKSGHLFEDKELSDYLNGVLRKLYPAFGTMRIHVMQDPYFYAFTAPNGSIYINTGLLAKCDNEAQMATILAHEAAHFVNRHAYRSRLKEKKATGLATGVALIGIPIAPQLWAVSSVFGYSRELEREADMEGFKRLKAASYDLREAPKIFGYMLEELKIEDVREPVFFSSHPRVKERMESYESLAAENGVGSEGLLRREEYQKETERVYLASLQAELDLRRHKSLIQQLTGPERRPGITHLDYFLGQAYRQRAEAGDDAKAKECFLKVIEQAPDFAPTYYALGNLCYTNGDYSAAKDYLTTFLQKAPSNEQTTYARHYLQEIEKAGNKN
jgi:predicted Zn-dependent protease